MVNAKVSALQTGENRQMASVEVKVPRQLMCEPVRELIGGNRTMQTTEAKVLRQLASRMVCRSVKVAAEPPQSVENPPMLNGAVGARLTDDRLRRGGVARQFQSGEKASLREDLLQEGLPEGRAGRPEKEANHLEMMGEGRNLPENDRPEKRAAVEANRPLSTTGRVDHLTRMKKKTCH